MPKKPPKRRTRRSRSAGQAKHSHRQKQEATNETVQAAQAPAPTTSPDKRSHDKKTAKEQNHAGLLQGWKQIAAFLGQPVATVQRWAKTGMPARREGRFMVASPDQLSAWLGKEAGVRQPVRIATDNSDLSTDLRRALAQARHHRRK